jgi:2-phosphosulfolactate phosphatase
MEWTMPFTDQSLFDARFEWGETGVRALAPFVSAMVIVDVLSFTTAVDIGVSRKASIYPFRWTRGQAARYAGEIGALLAVRRRDATSQTPYSLSPATIQALPEGTKLVLPSPNGATLSAIAAEQGVTVFAACLRNAFAVARVCRSFQAPIAVIAAGERWREDDSLRPAFEDLIGAGAVLAAFGGERPSPEARAAIAAFESVRNDVGAALGACASGRELIELGYEEDVEISAALDVSSAVPVLRGGAFSDWHALRER